MILVPGFRFAGVAAGIKKSGSDRPDLALLAADDAVSAAGVFTRNRVKAAPVLVSMDRVKRGRLRGVIVNAGNANACTGKQGRGDAEEMCGLAADAAGEGGAGREFAVASTGVIGVPLPMDRVRAGIARAGVALAEDGFERFAQAILTTDKGPKIATATLRAGKRTITVAGCAKGAGMIAPNMATTLSFLVTDAAADRRWLARTLRDEADATFNRVTVDGDTSTNDSLYAFASGAGGAAPATKLRAAIHEVMDTLAHLLVRDGEGATKVVTIYVTGAATDAAARAIARRIADSPLVKTAIGGADPNWGRVLCAIGNAGVAIDPERIDLAFGAVPIVRRGVAVAAPDTEAKAHAVMSQAKYPVHVKVGAGRGRAEIVTCDLTHEYVTINADYRS